MKVSIIQMNSISDKAANIAAAEALIERAVAEEGPDWVLLPEHFDWAGGFKADKLEERRELPRRPGLRNGAPPGDQASHLRPRRLDHGERSRARTASTTPRSSSTARARRSPAIARSISSTSPRRTARLTRKARR